jgi:CMP-N-acetylneuraminic acid synthetase
MSKIICIIPARGGSKRVPRKNIKELGGQPLLGYTIDAALESGVFDEIVVSSGDEEILSFADQEGIKTDVRPEPLRGDTVRTVEVIEEFVERPEIKEEFDNLAQMLPTCPFRTVEDIRNAHDVFQNKSYEMPVVSVTEYDFSPMHALELNEDNNTAEIREPEAYADTTRTQDIPDLYHPNGAIYFMSISQFLEHGEFFIEPLAASIMPPEHSIDIDHPHEFTIADLYMSHLEEAGER